jgi:hypothetical protein
MSKLVTFLCRYLYEASEGYLHTINDADDESTVSKI